MIEIIEYKGKTYPKFQSIGMASQFAIPFAKHVCIGEGYDIGCMKKEWAFPGSIPIDLDFDDEYHATIRIFKTYSLFSNHSRNINDNPQNSISWSIIFIANDF